MNESAKISNVVENLLQRFDKSLASTLTARIGKCIEDLGVKIENLLLSQSGLQMEVDQVSKSLQDSAVPVGSSIVRTTPATAYTSVLSATQSIVDELADRERRKKNVVMYDLPEAKDRVADKLSVLALLKTVYDLETPINRVVRLGRKIENKHRPLLVCFVSADDKASVVSRSYLLHHHDQYKRVFTTQRKKKSR